MFDNFASGGTMSDSDLYGSRGPGGGGGYLTSTAPATELASGPSGGGGTGPAWSWVGFIALLVLLRVLIDVQGDGE